MECIKCVFPRPAPPYKKRGLYAPPGDSATATETAWAILLVGPTTKVSKVYLGFKLPIYSAGTVTFAGSGCDAAELESVKRILNCFPVTCSIAIER